MDQFDVAISFGRNCRTAHHLRRIFGTEACPSGIFDWQITFPKALLYYLRSSFRGMFELADLEVDRRGTVRNRRTNTRHPHEFPDPATVQLLAEGYAKARSRHDHLAAKTLAILRGKQRVLIALSEPMAGWPYLRLWLAIRMKYPLLRFRLLAGPVDPSAHDLLDWQGSAEIWDRHLAGLSVGQRKAIG